MGESQEIVTEEQPPSLKAFRVFKLENNRLYKLYDHSIFAYKTTREDIYNKIHSKSINYNDALEFESFEGKKIKIGHIQNAAHNYRLRHARYLRELIFIRLISSLEVFSTDAIKEAFLAKRSIFHNDQNEQLSVPLSEFFSYKDIHQAMSRYIERETRGLQSQGYESIKKYYNSHFHIDFAKSSSDLGEIARFHQERHLLVHNLGKTDEQYRHKYNTGLTELTISEEQLRVAREEIFKLVLYVNNEFSKLLWRT